MVACIHCMIQISQIADNIEKATDGIYYSKHNAQLSYPEDGNSISFQLEENSFWFQHRNEVILACLNYEKEKKVFFDIGGGNGFVSLRLQNEKFNVTLIEPGIQGAKAAKRRGVDQVICSTFEDAGLTHNSMESAGMFDVIEHIEDDFEFLSSLYKLIQTEGKIYISVPAFQMLWSEEDIDAGHFRRYTLKSAEKVLLKAGFKPIYSTYFFSPLVLPIFLFRSIPSRLGLKRKTHDLKKYQREHKQRKGLVDKVLSFIWQWELKRISKRKKITFGSSCLIVAQKIK